MEAVEDVVICGAGVAGLATALGLYRKGVRCLVLESSESLRAAGFALVTWTNGWRALDALGVGDSLRRQHICLDRVVATSASSGATSSTMSFNAQGSIMKHEVRCVRRNLLLESLEKELPLAIIRYSSKVVYIEEAGNLKLLHLADGSTIKTKVLIGCDGVNSIIARWLGLKAPSDTGRSATRGLAEFPNGHGFKHEFLQFFGEGLRIGLLPCDDKRIYWFLTYIRSPKDKENEGSALKMRKFVLSKLRLAKVPEEVAQVFEKSDMSGVVSSPLRFRWPIELVWANISKENVCVAGDALHPMTPDLGQGGCSALEDGVVLARCLGDALLKRYDGGSTGEHEMIKNALEKYARERRWRSFDLIATAYVVGFIQQTSDTILSFLREKCLSGMLVKTLLKKADFDCGML